MRSHRITQGLNCSRRFVVYSAVGVLAQVIASPSAQAEGSVQIGQIDSDYDGGLLAETVMLVDVLAGDTTLNIVARGSGNVDVSVRVLAADGSVASSADYTLTSGSGLLTGDTIPAELPGGGVTPLTVPVEPGRYQVQFGEDVEPFDITVTDGSSATYNPTLAPVGGGRLSSRDWRFFGDLPGTGEVPMASDFYVRAAVGEDTEYIWKLDFDGLLGGEMCLTANDLGLPGEFARSSQPLSALGLSAGEKFELCDDLSQYDLYLSPPNNPKPQPEAPQASFFRLDDCGAVIAGTGGVFAFDSTLEGTFELVIDLNDDGVFDPKDGDVALGGRSAMGENRIPWDGLDAQGVAVVAGDYATRLSLRVGEFHFTGSDIEAASISVDLVDPDTLAETDAVVYWDDEALILNGGTGAVVPRSTPDGTLDPHSWRGDPLGGVTFEGPGENALVDTWVFGGQTTIDQVITIVEADADADGDGLVNGRECEIGSLAYEPDTDEDGVLDGYEEPSNTPGAEPRDSDEDGTPDALDVDDDDDGIATREEQPDPNQDDSPDDARDRDGDGTPDYLDTDDDGDGVPTEEEWGDGDNPQDTDGDDTPDYLDPDDDDDSIPTVEEWGDGDTPRDTDGDGTPDYLEDDDDDDGVRTVEEWGDGENARDTDEDSTPDYLDDDDDGDGILTQDELDDSDGNGTVDYLEPTTTPGDTDNDGVPDEVECAGGTGCVDTDGDGLPDYQDADDDGDSVLTRAEDRDENGDPRDDDADGDGTADYLDNDDDGDGVATAHEDTDGDGDPRNDDSDGNDVPDYLDEDDDGDGLLTSEESADPNGDGDPDDARDSDGNDVPDYLDEDDDGDSLLTSEESADPNGDGAPDDARDSDNNDVPDYLDEDDDGDGLLTSEESADPNGDGDPDDARDSDDNDVPDYLDPALEPTADSDSDGIPDTAECGANDDCPDRDDDGVADYLDTDDDGDGVPTTDELGNGDEPRDTNDDGTPDYLDTDDDGDGVPTADELGNGDEPRDTDDDGTPDYLDTDDDGDGVPTADELGNGDEPRDTDDDGEPDYLDPDDEESVPSRRPTLPSAQSLEGGGFGCTVKPIAGPTNGAWALLSLLLVMMVAARRRRRTVLAMTAGAITAGVTLSPAAQAQTSDGFSINRYNPAERGSDWFAGESLDLRGHGRLATGLVLDWAYKPLVSYDEEGEQLAAVIENQLYGHVGFAVNLWERLRLAASFPVLFYQNGTPVEMDGIRYATRDGAEVGDLRLSADLGLIGAYGGAFRLGAGVQVHLPTGDRGAYTSDGKVRFAPRVLLAGDVAALSYSAQVGVDLRAQRADYAGEPFGSDLTFGGTIGLRLADRRLLIGPELWGSTVISDQGDGLFEKRTTPFEGIVGAHYFAGDWRVGLGVGPGFTRGLGSPALRMLGKVEWFPEVEDARPAPLPSDSDNDGILDKDDACPATPGVASEDPTEHGCPLERPDRDADGIYDDEDACVDEAGVANPDKSKHGCPADSDGDGIYDRDDACVSEPGEANADKAKHGCPPPKDSDGDGINDEDDACPAKAGPASTDLTKHGCPRAEVSGERVMILDRIEFDTGKATIRPESEPILDAVRTVLEENPRIKKLRVEGHTDSRGARPMNVSLSQRRAESVVAWLVEHGIEGSRLVSRGLGPDKPVDDNATEAGRQNNRRVEFHIVDMAKATE